MTPVFSKMWGSFFWLKRWLLIFLENDGVLWFWKIVIYFEYKKCCTLRFTIAQHVACSAMKSSNSDIKRWMFTDRVPLPYNTKCFGKQRLCYFHKTGSYDQVYCNVFRYFETWWREVERLSLYLEKLYWIALDVFTSLLPSASFLW